MIFIANIASNWKAGGKSRALDLIDTAAAAGADVIEFPVFDQLYRDEEKQAQIDPYKLPVEWLPELADRTRNNGARFSLSLFDPIELPLEPDCYSLDSYNINVTPLLEYLSERDVPVFLSTGSADYTEIDDAVELIRPGDEAPDDVYLIHYSPGNKVDDLVLRRVLDLGVEFFPLEVGYETNIVNPYLVASTVLFDAKIIKVKFDGEDKEGIETNYSYTPSEFGQLVQAAKVFERARDCGCVETLASTMARADYRRDSSDWLRPIK